MYIPKLDCSDYKSTCSAKNKILNLLLLLAVHLGPLFALLAERVANLGDDDRDDHDDHDRDQVDHSTLSLLL